MSLIHKIAVTNNSYSLTQPLVQLVHKRLEYIRYGRIINDADIPLEYIGLDPLTSKTSLSVVHRAGEFLNNNQKSTFSFSDARAITGKNFSSESSDILITNQYQVLDDGSVNPYFYAHELPANTNSLTVQKVTNSGTTTVDTVEYTVDTNKTYLFASFLNEYDEISGRYTIYYIECVDTSGNFTNDLYNPIDAFHEATFDDIDPVTGTLYTDVNAYILNVSGDNFTFTLPKTDTYYIKEKLTERIQLLEPALDSASDAWFVRVTNGNFNQIIDAVSYNYSIEEYDLQLFTPSEPTKFAPNESAIRINKSLIKLQRENLYVSTAPSLPLDLLIYNKTTGDLLYALTTDTSREGNYYTNTIQWDSTKIADWDSKLAVVRIDDIEVREEYNIRAFYYYNEEAYEHTALNLNPLFNTDLEGYMVVFYVVPDTAGSNESSIYYLLVKDNIITYTSQTGGSVVPNISQYDGGAINPNSVIGTTYRGTGSSANLGFEDRYPQYLILAEITILEPSRIPDAARVDIRQPGGSVKTDSIYDAIKANSKIAYIPGIAPIGGYPYPQNATHVVKVPYTLLTDYGGDLTEDYIRLQVQRHMSAGEYAVIKFDGVIPEIYQITPGSCITLRWYLEDPTYTFNIYRSLNIDGGFTLLANVGGASYNYNEFTNCSVTSGVAYYYYITAVDANSLEGPPSDVWGTRAL